MPALSTVKVIKYNNLIDEVASEGVVSDSQVPTSSEYLGVGFCFDLQLIENNNINNAIKNALKELLIKDTILALDLT